MGFSKTVRVTAGDVTNTQTLTADGECNRDVSLSANSTNVEVDLDLVYTRVKVLAIECASALTIKTNSTSSPSDTLTLVGGQGLVWFYGSGFTNPLTADVTKLYLTSTAAQDVKIRVLYDSTP